MVLSSARRWACSLTLVTRMRPERPADGGVEPNGTDDCCARTSRRGQTPAASTARTSEWGPGTSLRPRSCGNRAPRYDECRSRAASRSPRPSTSRARHRRDRGGRAADGSGVLRTLPVEQGQRLAGRCLVADAAGLTLARLVDAQPAAPPADRASGSRSPPSSPDPGRCGTLAPGRPEHRGPAREDHTVQGLGRCRGLRPLASMSSMATKVISRAGASVPGCAARRRPGCRRGRSRQPRPCPSQGCRRLRSPGAPQGKVPPARPGAGRRVRR